MRAALLLTLLLTGCKGWKSTSMSEGPPPPEPSFLAQMIVGVGNGLAEGRR